MKRISSDTTLSTSLKRKHAIDYLDVKFHQRCSTDFLILNYGNRWKKNNWVNNDSALKHCETVILYFSLVWHVCVPEYSLKY